MGPKPYILLLFFILAQSSCTIHFKAEKLEMDSEIKKPGLELEIPLLVPDGNDIVLPFKISSFSLSNREEILCHLSNMEAALSKCLGQSPETLSPETGTEIMSVHALNQ